MRYTYARFKNYIAFYNGLGLHELEIDFSNSFNHIIVISGINGCGKSSLIRVFHPLPDESSMYIEGLPVEKEFYIMDSEITYHIRIYSPVTKSGRGTTKAFISKDGTELNPNGNVSSFKEIVFSEFDLSPNFISLSRLSSTDRGLADKIPSERKRFMSSIIDSLEVYNDIYKELNKKASIFRSYVNNLHSKIQNIGDEKALSLNLSKLVCKLNAIKQEEDEVKEIIATEKAKISIHDPNNDIQDRFSNAEKIMTEEDGRRKRIAIEFERACANMGLPPDLNKILEYQKTCDKTREQEEKQIILNRSIHGKLLEDAGKASMDMERAKAKIEKLESELDRSLQNKIEESRSTCTKILELLAAKGLQDRNATASEIQLIQKYVQKIIDLVDEFYQDSDSNIMELAVDQERVKADMQATSESYERAKASISEVEHKLAEYTNDASQMKILESRPNNCKVDTCPFIASAFELMNTKYKTATVEVLIEYTTAALTTLGKEVDDLQNRISWLNKAYEKSQIFSKIREVISDNSGLFCKTVHSVSLMEQYEDLLKTGNPLTGFRDVGIYSEIATLITKLSFEEHNLDSFLSDIKLHEERAKQITDLQSELDNATVRFEDAKKQSSIISADINSYSESLKETQNKLNSLINLITMGERLKESENRYLEASKEYERTKSIGTSFLQSFERLGMANQRLVELQNDRVSIEPTIASLQGQLSMLDSYKSEYALYDKKFKTVDLIRKYTSPSKGGIQSVFIQLYMSKTLELSNQLLQMLFSGEYRLLDFVIDQNEFRIPFVGSGMVVDDISSGSTSQICIIGSIINLVLNHQCSSKYNIASMDETDSGLDNYNKTIYGTSYLHKLVSVLGIEQLFVVSHSAEVELVNADIIRLRQHDNFNSSTHKGNVIYDYSKEKKTFE